MTQTVRVLSFSEPPAQDYLDFRLVFQDGYEKHITLDSYAIAAYRGLGLRDIIEEQARLYFEMLGEPADQIKLIFL